MDYYEELGVDRSASPAEIRQAYKRLARLLHPDHCVDEPSRQVAEIQMRRLNGIIAVLSDPAEREEYNRSLVVAPRLTSAARRRPSRRAATWLWPAVAAASSAMLLVGVIQVAQPVPVSVPRDEPAPPVASTPSPSPVRQARVQSLSFQSRRTDDRTPSIGGKSGPTGPLSTVVSHAPLPTGVIMPPLKDGSEAIKRTVTPAPIQMPETRATPTAEESPPPTAGRTLAGEWLFVPSTRVRMPGLYPPEYIELRVTESSGVLRGRYRARYRVRDRAISPNVEFQFQGRAEPNGGSLPWSGPAGSEGNVTLRLLANGALEVTWVANQMGNDLGLVSGTATLVRKLE